MRWDFSGPTFLRDEDDIHYQQPAVSQSRAALEAFITEAGVKHVLLDPLYDLVGSSDMSDRDMSVRGIQAWLTKLQSMGVTVVVTLMGEPTRGIRGTFGSKYLRMWIEDAMTIRRTDVRGHDLLSDFKITRIPKRWRDTHSKHTFTVRGFGAGAWADRTVTEPTTASRAQTVPRQRLEIVRESLRAEPNIPLRERALKTGISKSSLARLISKIEAGDES